MPGRADASNELPNGASGGAPGGSGFGVGLARAAGGALVFSLPLWMTAELWSLGFTVGPGRLALFVAAACPFLVALSHVAGFEQTLGLRDDVVDAAVAWAVGFGTSGAGLLLLAVLGPGMSAHEAVGTVALQAVPGSMGALLAQGQFNSGGPAGDRAERPTTYASQLVVSAAGALYLAFNIAPTREVVRLAEATTAWHGLALVAVSLGAMHAFVYALQFTQGEPPGPDAPAWSAFLRYTVASYALALLVSAYVLWTFGRLDDTGAAAALRAVLVLGFPAAVGAAAARLIL